MSTQISPEIKAIPRTSQAAVSIIIPSYNGARFLAEAIDSALRQTFDRIEVIVVDDGSTDSTREIALSYGDRLRYIFQQNAGLAAARNTGIKLATCPFISFLDSDDLFLPMMVEVMLDSLGKLPSDFALVACSPEYIDSEGKTISRRNQSPWTSRQITVRDLILMNRFPCTVVARREIFFECGLFDTTLTSTEDRDMWMRIAARHRIQLIPQKLVQIRRHGENMSRNAVRQSRNIRRVLWKAYKSQTAPRWDFLFWLKALSIYFFQSGFMHAEARSHMTAMASFLCSICLWPLFWDSCEVGQPRGFRFRRLFRIAIELLGWKRASAPEVGAASTDSTSGARLDPERKAIAE